MPELFQYDFMIRAMVAGAIASVLVPLAGVFVVARRSSMISDTIAHLALIGVGIGVLLHVSIPLSVLLVGIVAAIMIDQVIRRGRFPAEAVHSLFLSGGLAVALLLVHFADTAVDFESFLFGNILTVTDFDIFLLVLLGIPLVLFYRFFWWKLAALTIHDEFAESLGIRTGLLSMAFTVSVALAITLSLRVTGGLLIGALMVVPVLTAVRITKSMRQLVVASIASGFVAVMAGLVAAFYGDIPAGSAIVLASIFLFGGAYALSMRKGNSRG